VSILEKAERLATEYVASAVEHGDEVRWSKGRSRLVKRRQRGWQQNTWPLPSNMAMR
jgi:hypothetical protein